MKDQFQFATLGSTLNIHGASKWFKRGSFVAFNSSGFSGEQSSLAGMVMVVMLCSLITFLCTFSALIMVYDCYLKPKLVKRSGPKVKTN